MVQITGHRDGSTALDYTVNSAVGFPMVTGPARPDAPVNHVFPAWDVITGLTAATGILAAVRRRSATGEGEHITLALSDVGYATVGNLGHIGEAVVNGTERAPIGNDLYGAFGRDFATKDGRRVMVAANHRPPVEEPARRHRGHEAMRHVEAMLGLDLSDEGQRFEARDVIAPVVGRWIGARDHDEVRAVFDEAGVCWGPYQSFLEMVRDDPRCSTDNPLFEDVDQPGIGRFMMPARRWSSDATSARRSAPPPPSDSTPTTSSPRCSAFPARGLESFATAGSSPESGAVLTRISHQLTAADADLTVFAALNAARVPRVPLASQARFGTAACFASSLWNCRLLRKLALELPLASQARFGTAACFASSLWNCRLLRKLALELPLASQARFGTAACFASSLWNCRLLRKLALELPLASQARSVLSSTPARPDSRSPCENSHLRALARNLVRNAG